MRVQLLENKVVFKMNKVTMEQCMKVQNFAPKELVILEDKNQIFKVTFGNKEDSDISKYGATMKLSNDGKTPWAETSVDGCEDVAQYVAEKYASIIDNLSIIEDKIILAAANVEDKIASVKEKIVTL